MRTHRFAAIVAFASLAFASHAGAYFVIELRDGGELRADFVREDGGTLHASRGDGEVEIDKSRVLSVREVDSGVKVDEAKAVAEGMENATPKELSPPTSPATSVDAGEREDEVVHQIILGHRELLFARLRGEAAADLEKRERDLKKLDRERDEIRQGSASSSEPAPAR